MQLSDGTDATDPGLVSGVVNPGKGSEFSVPLTSLEAKHMRSSALWGRSCQTFSRVTWPLVHGEVTSVKHRTCRRLIGCHLYCMVL